MREGRSRQSDSGSVKTTIDQENTGKLTIINSLSDSGVVTLLGSAQESVKVPNWRGFEDRGDFGMQLPVFFLIEVLDWRVWA